MHRSELQSPPGRKAGGLRACARGALAVGLAALWAVACKGDAPPGAEADPVLVSEDCAECGDEEFCYSGQCRPLGEAVIEGDLGDEVDQFGASDLEEAESEAPRALAATPNGGLVYVLDQLNSRVSVFKGTEIYHGFEIDGTTAEELALLPDERVVVRDRYDDEFRVYDLHGMVASRSKVTGAGVEGIGFVGALYSRDDGIWMKAGDQFVHVLDQQGEAVERRRVLPGLPSPDLKTLLTLRVLGDGSVELVTRPTQGEAKYQHHQLYFDEPTIVVIAQDIDGEGRIYLVTEHQTQEGERHFLLTVLSPELKVLRQTDLPDRKSARAISRPVAISRSGSVFYLDLAEKRLSVKGF